MIIGVTDEDPALVEKWVAMRKPTYPIVVLKDSSFDDALGVEGVPTTAVVDPKGNLCYFGYTPHTAIAKAQANATRGSIWPARFAKVVESMRAGDLGKSYAELKKQAGSELDAREKAVHDRFVSYLEDAASSALAKARQHQADAEIYRAVKELEPVAAAKPEFPSTAEASKLLSEIRDAPGFKSEMQGGQKFEDATALAEAKQFYEAVNAFKAIAKNYPKSKIGGVAIEKARVLIDKGLPGYESSCDRCQRAKKACRKHKKEVAL